LITFQVTILGSNSAKPAHGRFMSSQLVNFNEIFFLIDCAEGTQFRFQDYKIKYLRIKYVLISHLHGDHIFGLPGVLLTMSLNNRYEDLHICGPFGIKDFIENVLKISQSHLSFKIIYKETDPSIENNIYVDDNLTIISFPLKHRIPTQGYFFRESYSEKKLNKIKIKEFGIPYQFLDRIKRGEDWINSQGEKISNAELTIENPNPRSFAYCSDTEYDEGILNFIKGSDLLYHEATFMHELLNQAVKTGHSTAIQAASIAKLANVKKLLIGHFSSRYSNLNPLLEEAKSVFNNTELAIDGSTYVV
jgi:ribonuclease Z